MAGKNMGRERNQNKKCILEISLLHVRTISQKCPDIAANFLTSQGQIKLSSSHSKVRSPNLLWP